MGSCAARWTALAAVLHSVRPDVDLDVLRGLVILPVILFIGLAGLGLQTVLRARRTRGAAQGLSLIHI